MNRPVVSNAGPLLVFSKLNVLHLLKALYGRVHFPVSVYRETVISGIRLGFSDAHTLRLFFAQNKWVPVAVGKIPADLSALHLDRGEKESIFLTLKKNALLLMDEERGRTEARKRDLFVKGSLGILIEAYRKGFIDADQLRFYFEQIAERPDIWISPDLCNRLLDQIL